MNKGPEFERPPNMKQLAIELEAILQQIALYKRISKLWYMRWFRDSIQCAPEQPATLQAQPQPNRSCELLSNAQHIPYITNDEKCISARLHEYGSLNKHC